MDKPDEYDPKYNGKTYGEQANYCDRCNDLINRHVGLCDLCSRPAIKLRSINDESREELTVHLNATDYEPKTKRITGKHPLLIEQIHQEVDNYIINNHGYVNQWEHDIGVTGILLSPIIPQPTEGNTRTTKEDYEQFWEGIEQILNKYE